MGAIVYPQCGHASHLLDISVLDDAPQIHIHFLTEEYEEELYGVSKLEFCCHGCGKSLLVYYAEPQEDEDIGDEHEKVRASFVDDHRFCPNRDYENLCPNHRTSFEVKDLRNSPLRKIVPKIPTPTVWA